MSEDIGEPLRGNGGLSTPLLQEDGVAEIKKTKDDLRLVQRAIRRGWNVPNEKRPIVIDRLFSIVEKRECTVMTKNGPEALDGPADTNSIQAAKALIDMDKLDQTDYWKSDTNDRLDKGLRTGTEPVLIVTPWSREAMTREYQALPGAVEVSPIVMGESFAAIASLPDQFILVESRRGTGKTRGHLTLMMELALRHKGSRWLVVRSTRSRLTDSAIATFVEQVLPLFNLPIPKCDRKGITTYTLPNGSEFVFQGLDDEGRQQSVECSGVLVVEGCEIDKLDTITALAGAMRKVSDPPIENFRCIVEVNPDAPGHPLNQIAEPLDDSYRIVETREQYERVLDHNRKPCETPGKWKRVVTHFFDNPGFFDVAKWTWTKAGEQYLKTLGWLVGNLKKRWLYGLWTAAQGSVFGDVFDVDVHVVDDFVPPLDWPQHNAWDSGVDHPTGIPFVWISPAGDLFVGDEIYMGGKSIAQHVAENVNPRMKGHHVKWWGDPHHFFHKTAQSLESCADQAVKAGLSRAEGWADLRGTAKIAGVNAVLQILQNTVIYIKTGVRRGPCLFVMRKCKHSIMEFQSWSYKRNTKGEQLDGDDRYEDRDNHILDGLIGMIATGMLKYVERGKTIEVSDNQ